MDTTGLFILKDKNIVPYEIKEKKVILCGVPGAFTPGCTNRHLPGFVDNLGKLKEKGIEKVIFMDLSMTHLLWMSGTSYMVINKSMPSLILSQSLLQE